MASTYVNDLRLNEMATGDQSGSWGTVTNTNLELIAEAFSYSTEAITTNADAHTTTIADGATDPGRSMFLKYTGTLDSACTITIGPNTVSKLWFIENATSGSQNIIIKQGSGATVTIANGKTKVIYSDGVGSGAKMVDAFAALDVGALSGTTGTFSGAVSGASATFDGGVDIDNITIDGNEIDVNSGDLTLDVAGDINLDADGGDIRLKDGGTQFGVLYKSSNDFSIYSAISDGDMKLQGLDGSSVVTALTLDMSAAGAATFNDAVKLGDGNVLSLGVGNDLEIYSDGTNGQVAAQNGNLTLDVAGDISLDAGGTDIYLKTSGNSWGHFMTTSNNFYINSTITDGDIIFQGVDGGSGITALTLDMSEGGIATFGSHIELQDNKELRVGNSHDLRIYHYGGNSYVQDSGSGQLRLDTNGTDVRITKTDSEYMGKFIADGGVELFYNNSKKFETTSSGVTVTGDVNATNFNSTSDATLKTNVETLTGSLDAVKSLRGVSFDWLEDGSSEVGVIAQEVEDVLPDVVNTNEDGIKSVKYGNMVAVLIEAMKEQQAQIDELKSQLNS